MSVAASAVEMTILLREQTEGVLFDHETRNGAAPSGLELREINSNVYLPPPQKVQHNKTR